MSDTTLSLSEREPLALRAAVTVAVTAVVHLLVVFGVPLPEGAEASVAAVVDAVGLVVLIVWSRRAVVPAAKVISRVTTDGDVVTGQAADLPVGTELASDVRAPVRAELVKDPAHTFRDGELVEGDVVDEGDPFA